MKILVAGASGFVGRGVVASLQREGHTVTRLVRRPARAMGEVDWDPAAGRLAISSVAAVDAVINLSGENIGAGRWTRARREAILRSRIQSTRTLVHAMGASAVRPAVLVNASAVGVYGAASERTVTDDSPPGGGFLAEVCSAWEGEADRASALGVRVVLLRLGMVLGPDGGALAKLLPVFRWGLGGRLGHGRQWMNWVHLDDVVGVAAHALADVHYSGPINVVSPNPVANAEFTQSLARTLRRPAWLPAPAFALRLLLGQMADEALLAGPRAAPEKLRTWGYEFRQPDLEPALREIVSRA